MKYQIIGASTATKETKKGSHYRILSVIPTLKELNFIGLHGTEIMLWDSALANTSVETEDGEFYAKNDKKYFIDIDYDRNGYIISARVYNG